MIHFAPVQGHTDAAYRRLHAASYTGADIYYTPFIRLEHGAVRARDLRDIDPEANAGYHLVPQLIFRDRDELLPLVAEMRRAGATELDINMGCPFPLQTARGRGAATAGNPDAARLVAETVRANPDIRFSVKMRLGMEQPDEWEATLPILNGVPLTHITLHPRVARQQYGGEVDMDQFNRFCQASVNKVVYNGDLRTPEDMARVLESCPGACGVMLGRGILGRPSLAAEFTSGRTWDRTERIEAMLAFHRRLLRHYEESLCGDAQIISKIKPFWEYAEPEIGRKAWKAIRKAGNMARYNSAIALID